MTQTTYYELNKFVTTDKMNPTTLGGLNDNADKIDTALHGKQDALTPGTNISITSGTISTTAEVNVIDGVKVNGTALTPDANKDVDVTVPVITYSTTDLTPGVSELATGTFYFVYE